VRAKLTAATACPEDSWRSLELFGCSAADEEAAAGGFGGSLRLGSSRTASGAQAVVDGEQRRCNTLIFTRG
jgi:hypothetical protein